MNQTYHLSEARLAQSLTRTSAADALNISLPAVPTGKFWNIIAAGLYPSVAETRLFFFERISAAAWPFPLTPPISYALDTVIRLGLLSEGTELVLLPGESLGARRSVATAGSGITIYAQFIESDLPLYTYDEPQIVKRQARSISSLRSRLGGGIGRGGGELPGRGGGPVRGGPFPV